MSARDVDDAGVTAAGEHQQAAPSDVHDERLVVQDQRIGLPCPVPQGLVDSEPPFEVGAAGHLAGAVGLGDR